MTAGQLLYAPFHRNEMDSRPSPSLSKGTPPSSSPISVSVSDGLASNRAIVDVIKPAIRARRNIRDEAVEAGASR